MAGNSIGNRHGGSLRAPQRGEVPLAPTPNNPATEVPVTAQSNGAPPVVAPGLEVHDGHPPITTAPESTVDKIITHLSNKGMSAETTVQLRPTMLELFRINDSADDAPTKALNYKAQLAELKTNVKALSPQYQDTIEPTVSFLEKTLDVLEGNEQDPPSLSSLLSNQPPRHKMESERH